MQVLIVGGTGLISGAITTHLVEGGHKVTLYNRGQTQERIPATGVQRICGDRYDYAAFEAQMAEAGPFDCVIDVLGRVPADAESAVRAFAGRTQQYIFCSTTDVYRKPADRYPIIESEPRRSTYAYGQDKAACEDILMAAHARGDFLATIIRPAGTYGEGTGIITTFSRGTSQVDRLRKGKPLIVHGDGSTLTVACHASDVGRAFANAVGNPRAYGHAYHATGEEWLTWNRFWRIAAQAIGAPEPRLVHIPTDALAMIAPQRARRCVENYQHHNIYDNTAARVDLGFRYTIPWAEGFRRTYDWLVAADAIENSDDDPFDDRVIAAWEQMKDSLRHSLSGLES